MNVLFTHKTQRILEIVKNIVVVKHYTAEKDIKSFKIIWNYLTKLLIKSI